MDEVRPPIVILMADDDPDDVMFTQEAMEETKLRGAFYSVSDGAELLDYLKRRGQFDEESAPRPDLILLDLNMPRMNGLDALDEIKDDPSLKAIPIIVLTTSIADEDVVRTYDLGASSFIQKPVGFNDMVDAMTRINQYWFGTVELPAVH